MGLDISKLILERCNYPMAAADNPDPMIDTIIDGNPDRCFLLTPEGLFKRYHRKSEALKQYYVTAIFDMGALYYPYTSVKLSVFVLSKKQPKVLKTGRYVGELKRRKKPSPDFNARFQMIPIDPLPEEYLQYCKTVETWINNGGTTPSDTVRYEFNVVNYALFDIEMPYVHRYTKQYMTVLEQLKKEKISVLQDVAEVISPVTIKNAEDGFTLSASGFVYPFNRTALTEGRTTKTAVQKGDIVISRAGSRSYLITDELKDVYINRNMFVIRPLSILPEYLFVYLNSETGKMIQEANSTGTKIKTLSKVALAQFPVIIPEAEEEYREVFQTMYVSAGSVDSLNRTITTLDKPTSDLQGLLKEETIRKLTLMKDPAVRDIILADIDELKRCYKSSSYKATLILAGSVLEAFLIDWLSEIDGIDYFNTDTRSNPSYPANLVDYINAIKTIKRPYWMEEAKKAHTIRLKRNIVHAKLCMKNTTEINDETCRMVIEYLMDIISTRYRDMF